MSLPIYDALDEARGLALGDNLRNLVTGMGGHKDKGAHGRFEHHWLDGAQLEAMYVNDWVAAAAVDAIADDMTREWRTWHGAKQTVAAMVRAEKDLGVRAKVSKALKQSRTFGGAGILIGDGSPDPARELVLDRIPKGGIKYLHSLSRWELVSGPLCRDPSNAYFGEPEYYTLATPTAEAGVPIHPSRVVRLVGVEHLEASRQVDCWGYSVLQRVYDSVRNAASSAQGLAALVQEAKIDVVKIEGLTEKSVDLGWRNAMLARLGLANQGKSISGMLLLDTLEEYTQKQVSLAELPAVLMVFLEICAGAAGMPLTRLLGKSPGGLGSNGAGEIRHYYDTCSSKQETDLRPPLARLDRVLKRHAIGHEPANLDYRWVPLWQMTDAEKAAISLQKAQAVQVLLATNLIPFMALAKSVQSQVSEDGLFPGFDAALAEEIAAGNQVTEPPPPPAAVPGDGSTVKNPATLNKTAREPGDE